MNCLQLNFMKYNFEFLFTLTAIFCSLTAFSIETPPKIYLFEYSKCIEQCNNYKSIINKKYSNDSLVLRIGALNNCVGKFTIEIDKNNDVINIIINPIHKKYINRDGIEITEIKECLCYFYFDIGIKGVYESNKEILLNGHEFIGTGFYREEENEDIEDSEIVDIIEINYDEDNFQFPYKFVEKMPEFPGGEIALRKWIANNIEYPKDANYSEIKRTKLYVKFVVTETGDIADIKVIHGINEMFDAEAVRVIQSLPKFIPGEHNGTKVNVYYTLLVEFDFR